MATPRILVVGSINVDIVVLTERLPASGETVTGGTLLINHGGKGANQAVAARRLGAEVRFIGCVGDDTFGPELRQGMAAEGIGVDGLATIAGINSGTAVIVVDAAGCNQIAVASGANLRLTVYWVTRFAEDIAWAQVVVCQLEVPLDTVLWTLRTARQHGAITVLNPAPAQPLPSEIWPLVDYLTPNEIEAAHLSGLSLSALSDPGDVARALLARGLCVVILTLGAQGAFVGTLEQMVHVPAFPVTVVDTTAAGDTFNGALAVALAEGRPLERAVRFANAAAGLACTQRGAQNSLPVRAQVDTLLMEKSPETLRGSSMDNEQQRQQSEQSRVESALLKRQEEFHQLMQECQECQRAIEPHWQVCAHCGVRLATHCPRCGNPLPPAGAHACARCGLALPQIQP